MEPQLKQRLVGATVLVALAVIFVPALIDKTADGPALRDEDIGPGYDDEAFNSRIIPLNDRIISDARQAADASAPAAIDGEPETDTPLDADGLPFEPPPAVANGDPAPAVEDSPPGPRPEAAGPVVDPAPVADVPVPPRPAAGTTSWVVQLGVFTRRDNAQALQRLARDGGFEAYIEPVTGSNGTVYRVRVGPELLRSKAQQIRDRIAATLNIDGQVRQYP